MLTGPTIQGTLSQKTLREGGLIVMGRILCTRCRREMDGVCNRCENGKCLIRIHWRGKYYEFRRNDRGYVFTYDEARDKLLDISKEVKAGTFDPASMTAESIRENKFEYQIELWLEEQEHRYNANELSWGTLRDYRGYVKNYYQILNDCDVRKVELKDITRVKDGLNSVSIKTRRNVLNGLKTFFRWLINRGTIPALPRIPEVTGEDGKQGRPINYEAQQEVLTRLPEKDRDIIFFLMETGLRPGEACALLVEHLDLSQGIMRIERTFTGSRIRETSKQKKKRVIPLSDTALEIARKHAQGKHPQAFLFINSGTSRHYIPDTLWRIWHMHSGLNIRLYDGTRHSFGSQLATESNLYQVSKLMGHSSVKMTEKYLDMQVEDLRSVVNKRLVIALKTNSNRTGLELKKQGISDGKEQ